MELILQGWINKELTDKGWTGYDYNITIGRTKGYGAVLAEEIMDYFNYKKIDEGLGKKHTFIENANLRMWFSDEECTLEEAQMNFDSYMESGNLFTKGSYVGYSEWTITGFYVEELTIGGHDLQQELEAHIGQYCHLILTD